jgi:septal ring factor EnvC (AmiA/AmiB activator)
LQGLLKNKETLINDLKFNYEEALSNEKNTSQTVLNKLNEQLVKMTNERDDCRNQMKDFNQKISQIEAKSTELAIHQETLINNLNGKLEQEQKLNEKFKFEIQVKDTKLTELTKLYDQLTSQTILNKSQEEHSSSLIKENQELTNTISTYSTQFNQIKETLESFKEEKTKLEKLLSESELKLLKLQSDLTASLKENKEIKNKIAEIKTEFNQVSNEKEEEISNLKESLAITQKDKEGLVKSIQSLALKISLLDEN